MKLILLPCINREKNKIKGYKQNIRKYTSVLLIYFVKAFVLMTGKSLWNAETLNFNNVSAIICPLHGNDKQRLARYLYIQIYLTRINSAMANITECCKPSHQHTVLYIHAQTICTHLHHLFHGKF